MSDRRAYFKAYAEEQKGTKHRVKSTFTVAEFEQIQKLAAEYNLKPASFVREVTLASMQGKTLLDNETKQELRNLSFLISNIANNVNQIARHTNRVQSLVDEVGLLDQLKNLDETVRSYIETGKAQQ